MTFSADISCSVMFSFFSNLLSLSRGGGKTSFWAFTCFFIAAERVVYSGPMKD